MNNLIFFFAISSFLIFLRGRECSIVSLIITSHPIGIIIYSPDIPWFCESYFCVALLLSQELFFS